MKKFIVFTIITLFIATLVIGFYFLNNYFYPKQYVMNENGEYIRITDDSDNENIVKPVAVSNNRLDNRPNNKVKTSEKKGYIAKSFNGTIVILNADGKTVYEFTKITINLLPEDLQEEVLKGYPLDNDEALYNFLETYSS